MTICTNLQASSFHFVFRVRFSKVILSSHEVKKKICWEQVMLLLMPLFYSFPYNFKISDLCVASIPVKVYTYPLRFLQILHILDEVAFS